MSSLNDILKKIGMTDEQISIYSYALKFSETTTTQLAKLCKRPRSSIYDQVQIMITKHWMSQNIYGNRTSYSAVDPKVLINGLESSISTLLQTQSLIQSNIHLFDELKGNHKSMPKVRVYEGIEAIQLLQQQGPTMKHGSFFWNAEAALQYLGWSMDELVEAFTVPNAIVHRSLLIDNEAGRGYIKRNTKISSNVHEIRLLPPDAFPFSSDTLLMDGLYTHISYGEQIVAIQVNDPIYYQTQQALFDLVRKLLD